MIGSIRKKGKPTPKIVIADPLNQESKPAPVHQFSPTQSQRVMVAALAACDVRHDGIASYIRINEATLRKYFRYELEEGYDRTEAALVGVLVVKAMAGNMTAMAMLLKSKFGWRESGKTTDGPATIDSLSIEQRASLIKALRASSNAGEVGSGAGGKDQADLVSSIGTAD